MCCLGAVIGRLGVQLYFEFVLFAVFYAFSCVFGCAFAFWGFGGGIR